jgi:hypothetical protein
MSSPSQPEDPATEATSPRPTLLPSPFTHSDEQTETSPSLRGSPRKGGERQPTQLPQPVQATSASIYEGDAPETRVPRYGGDEVYGGEEMEGEGEEDDEEGYPGEEGSLLPPQNFHPFFTLITDDITGETYHPSTYYIFADDEPDLLTTASLHALDSYTPQPSAQGEATDSERYIILDLAPTGTNIQQAKCLSPEWAITGAEIRNAPTFQATDDAAEGGAGEGLMIVIEGMGQDDGPMPKGSGPVDEATRSKKSKDLLEEARKRGGGSLVQGMEELRMGICGGLSVLDKIVGLDTD